MADVGAADRSSGMRTFTFVWVGQLLSIFGTALTQFGLTVWAWQETGQATALALVGFFTFAPTVLLSPVAGALVDRWNRKLVMMLSDIGSALATLGILILHLTGSLEIWHLYVAGAIAGAFQAFQFLAYSAAITMIVAKAQYGRASGMLSLAESAAGILAPGAAGALLAFIGLQGILVVDLVTVTLAVTILLLVRIPQPSRSTVGAGVRHNLWQESLYGFGYIFSRPSLLGLQLVFFGLNLIATFGGTVTNPMILARTGNNATVLGTVQSIGGVGGVVGALIMSAWGGPKRRVHGILLGMAVESVFGGVLLGLGRGLAGWAVSLFCLSLLIPIINGSNQAIWQAKVPPEVQGRVFATRRLIAQVTVPIALLMAGPLADKVFEPAMRGGGALAATFGPLVGGTGIGTGMSVMVVLAGLLGISIGLGGYLFPAVRNAEDLIPDHDASGGIASCSPA